MKHSNLERNVHYWVAMGFVLSAITAMIGLLWLVVGITGVERLPGSVTASGFALFVLCAHHLIGYVLIRKKHKSEQNER